MLLLLLISLLVIDLSQCDSPRWDLMRQSGYEVSMHRFELEWYNETYLKVEQFAAVKFNRTFRRVFNFSAHLYKEIGIDLSLSAQLYKLYGNEYKFFPFSATLLFCIEYQRNSFGLKDMLTKFTNLKLCPQKPGYIYGINIRGEHNKFPPLMPVGDYKVTVKLAHSGFNKDKLITINAYGAVISKRKLPMW